MDRSSFTFLAWLALIACDRAPRAEPAAPVPPASASPAARRPDPIRVEPLDARTPPIFVVRGEPRGPGLLVFLHGMCGHGMGYAQSFQFSAAARGRLIAPQGDVVCGKGPWAMWSADLEALDRRIVDAFRALGEPEPIRDIVAIGYSQGATRAEALARRWPERYTRLILMGAPRATSARGLGALKSAVMMAGERDRKDQMKAGARALGAAGVPATFIEIPEATHGAMGPEPERTMGAALEWLFSSSDEQRGDPGHRDQRDGAE